MDLSRPLVKKQMSTENMKGNHITTFFEHPDSNIHAQIQTLITIFENMIHECI